MNISVALSFDNNYAVYAHVVVYSALKNKLPETHYHFYLLVTPDLKDEYKQKLTSMCDAYSCEATFIDMKDEFASAKTWHYFTTPVYYRLSIQDVIPDDKCIYLDCDTLVVRDLSEFFSIDIEDYYVAGVRDLVNTRPRYLERLAICKPMMYINSGSILLNLKNLRKNNVKKDIDSLLNDKTFQESSSFLDQDALNKVCSGHVKIIPLRFNWFEYRTGHFHLKLALEKIFPETDISTVEPVVVHFFGDKKPWFAVIPRLTEEFSDVWWQYAKETEVYLEILSRSVEHKMRVAARISRDRFKILANYWRCRILSFFYNGLKKEHYQIKTVRLYEQWKFARNLLQAK